MICQNLFPRPKLPSLCPRGSRGCASRIVTRLRCGWAASTICSTATIQCAYVWAAVCRLDLTSWLREVKAVQGHVGRDATDPRLLVALWVYATLKGIGSARELARLCAESLPYQWLCGGVTVNYHTLSDFRSQGGEKWDELLTQIVAVLVSAGLVSMERVAQDGMRVRASAGKSSFRRRGRLEECLEEARTAGRDAQATGRGG